MADNLTIKNAVGADKILRATEDAAGVYHPHHIVEGSRKKFRDSFGSASLTDNWVSTVLNGSTVALSGAGTVVFTTGSTAGGYAELLSTKSFELPVRVAVGVATGTRSTNLHYYIELVSVNPTTGVIDEQSVAAWSFGGIVSTTATLAQYEVGAHGAKPLASANSTITTTSTASILEIEAGAVQTRFSSRVMDAVTARTNEYVRNQSSPDPEALYKLRIRTINAGAWKTISGAISGTGSVIRLTVTSHGLSTSNSVWVEGIPGVTNNGAMVRGFYTITSVDANTIELQSTVFAGTYRAGTGRCALAAAPTSRTVTLSFVAVHDHPTLSSEIIGGRGSTDIGSAVPVSIVSGSGGGGGGDASAANQTTQIAAETAIQTAVEIMDDWDESDRAKVNSIVGQAGVAGGAGATGANTQRTVTASDSPEIALLGGVTETAPASDTASSGANGRLQRIAQRITSLIALFPSSIGQKAKTGSLSVVLASDDNAVTAAGRTAVVSATFTRPADTTAYASGDLMANSTTAGSVTALSFTAARVAAGSGMIRRARIRKSTTTTTNASFRLHFYQVTAPTVTNGDNGVWLSNGVANYMGFIDITVDKAFSDGSAGQGAPTNGAELNFSLSSGQTVHGLLEARGAYAPGNAEVFNIDLEVLQN